MSIEMIGGGDGLSLLRDCAQNCADNGGDWYTPEQVLSVLSECVGNPALLGDSAFIGMATPERILDLFRQRDALVEALKGLMERAEFAMEKANNDGSEFDLDRELEPSRAAISAVGATI